MFRIKFKLTIVRIRSKPNKVTVLCVNNKNVAKIYKPIEVDLEYTFGYNIYGYPLHKIVINDEDFANRYLDGNTVGCIITRISFLKVARYYPNEESSEMNKRTIKKINHNLVMTAEEYELHKLTISNLVSMVKCM